jgi:S-adenosylmethionine:tRNA ribosyltransferase-isomerase
LRKPTIAEQAAKHQSPSGVSTWGGKEFFAVESVQVIIRSVMPELNWFDYILPPHLIAQQPAANRADARLMVVDRARGQILHRHVRDLPELLRAGDSLVTNNTLVLPARLLGYRVSSRGRWEGLYLSTEPGGEWRMLCKTRGKLKPPEPVQLVTPQGGDDVRLWLLEQLGNGIWLARPESDEPPFELLERVGRVPLPPYIRKGEMNEADRANYQTVFASKPGAAAAPTAGLHFTKELLARLKSMGIERHEVTLHVGLDTFRPITADAPSQHRMHSEWGELSEETASALRAVRPDGGRIIAVGTTSVRVLETAAASGDLQAWSGDTALFIRPPFEFHAVDALMTNFHLPRTTLLLLVSAFAGEELIRRAYDEAIREQYRFFSYGDAMLIV